MSMTTDDDLVRAASGKGVQALIAQLEATWQPQPPGVEPCEERGRDLEAQTNAILAEVFE